MRIKGITDEDFVNYQFPSMYICTSECDFKCDKENGYPCCQNSELANTPTIVISDDELITRFMCNDITVAIVIGGLEPFDQFDEVFNFISKLRFDYHCNSRVVIYTGYNKDEIAPKVDALKMLDPIIIKFGRYIPGQEPHLDPVLGVKLASDNQYATWIS